MAYVDFAELKARLMIDDVASMLGLVLKQSGDQLRGTCPVCDTDDDRAIVITPAKQAFYCFHSKKGGDFISLAAHIRGVGMKEAAQFIADRFTVNRSPEKVETGTSQPSDPLEETAGWSGLDYLLYDHEMVQALGLDVETAEKLGIGYANKGIMRGKVAWPVRLDTGKLVGYIGITDAKLPPRWHL